MSERLRRGEEPERRYRKLPRDCSAFRTWGSHGQTYARISTGNSKWGKECYIHFHQQIVTLVQVALGETNTHWQKNVRIELVDLGPPIRSVFSLFVNDMTAQWNCESPRGEGANDGERKKMHG